MPIRNWGGGGDPSDTFLALQDEFLRQAKAARDRAIALAERAAAASGGGGGRSGGSGRRRSTSSEEVRAGVANIAERMAAGQTDWRALLNYYREELRLAEKGSALHNALKAQIENVEFVLTANGIPIPAAGASGINSPMEAAPATGVLSPFDELTPEIESIVNDQVLYLITTHNGIYAGGENPLQSLINHGLENADITSLRDVLIADAKMNEEMLEEMLTNPGGLIVDRVSGELIEATPQLIMDTVTQGMNNQWTLLGLERGLGVEGDFQGRWGHTQNYIRMAEELFTNNVMPMLNTDGELLHPNAKGVQGFVDEFIMNNFNITRNTALESGDPYEAQMMMRDAAKNLKREVVDLQNWLGQQPEGIGVDDEMNAVMAYTVRFADYITLATSNTQDPFALQQEAANLFNERPDGFYLSASELEATIGTNEASTEGGAPGWTGIIGAAYATAGLDATAKLRQGNEAFMDYDNYVWVTRHGETTPVAVRASMAAQYLGIDGELDEEAFPFIEKVTLANGSTTEATVWRQLGQWADAEDTQWLAHLDVNGEVYIDPKTGQPQWATMEEFLTVGNDINQQRLGGFTMMPVPAVAGLLTVIDSTGDVWYTNENRTGISKKMPLNLPLDGDFHPTQLLDANGNMDAAYNGRNGLMVGIGPGVSRKTAQAFFEEAVIAEEIKLDSYQKYDPMGLLINSPTMEDVLEHLWNPQGDAAMLLSNNQSRYQRDWQQKMELTVRQERRQREEEQRMAEQMLAEQERQDSFGAQALQDNAIEAGIKQAGVHFGVSDRRLRRQVDPSVDERRQVGPPIPPPIGLDDLHYDPKDRSPAPVQPSNEVPQYTPAGKGAPAGVRPI